VSPANFSSKASFERGLLNSSIREIKGFHDEEYNKDEDGRLDYLNNIYKDKEIFDLVRNGVSQKRIERAGTISKIENSYINRDLQEFGIDQNNESISENAAREMIKYGNITSQDMLKDILSLCSNDKQKEKISITVRMEVDCLKEYKGKALKYKSYSEEKSINLLEDLLVYFVNYQENLCSLYEKTVNNNDKYRFEPINILYKNAQEQLKTIDAILFDDKKYIDKMSEDLRDCTEFKGALSIINNKYVEICEMQKERHKGMDEESITRDIARINIRIGKGDGDDTKLNDIFDKKSIEIMNQIQNNQIKNNQIDKMDFDSSKDIMKSCRNKLESMDKYEFSHRKEMSKEMEKSKDLEELQKTIIKYEKMQVIEVEMRIKQNLRIERSIFLNRDRNIEK